MYKREKQHSQDVSLSRQQNKNSVGIATRQRNPQKLDQALLEARNQEKRRAMIKKESYVPPSFTQPTPLIHLQPNQFQSLVQELVKRSHQLMSSYLPIDILYEIYKDTINKGGVVQVSSINSFNSIVRFAIVNAQKPQIMPELSEDLIERTRQLLFSIQFITKNESTAQKKIYQLGLVNFIGKQQLREHVKDKVWGLNYFNFDLTLFQQGAESIGVDKQIFNLEFMCEHYKKQKIDIRIQNPLDYGFKPAKLKNKAHQMTLGQYRFYQLNFRNPNQMKAFKHSDYLGKGQVFFGVNFEPSDQMLNKQIKKNVQGTFLDYHGDFDMLSYLDTDVPGCSLPQMYFKTPGCWTGGHQQNICMSALNINNGPDYSQWFTLELKYIPQLRNQLLKEFNTDLYLSEGLWYEKLDWFISRGYPVKRFLQRKDDIVVTGPGTLHWVRSFGTALQTSWNIMPKNYDQFCAAFYRHKLNKQIKFHKSDTIPLKSIIMKYLNHERTIMKQNTRILCINQLQQWYNEEQNLVDLYLGKVKKFSHFYLKDLQSFCCQCRQQVLVYFLPAPAQKQRGISCLQCFFKNEKDQILFIQQMYFKHEAYWVSELIRICQNKQLNSANPRQIQQLCKGFHVGQIPTKCVVASKLKNQFFPIYDPETIKDQKQIQNAQRQIFYESQYLYQLYQKFAKAMINCTNQFQNKISALPRERIKPVMKNSSKMMTMVQQGQMEQNVKEAQTNTELMKAEIGCQTDIPFLKQKQQDRQSGELSQSRSRDKKKKKQKKDKSKKKHKKKKDDSPKFSSQSEQKKRNSSGSVKQGQNQFNSKDNRDNTNFNRRSSSNNNGDNRGGWRDNNNGDNRGWRDNNNDRNNDNGFRGNKNYGNNRNDRNQQGREYGNNNRNNNWDNNNDNGRYDRGNRDFGNNNEHGGYNRGNRDFGNNQGGWNDNRGGQRNFNREDRGDFQNRGRGRGGGRGRGRGGFNRDNNFRNDRNNEDGNRNEDQNNKNDGDNNFNNNFDNVNNEPKCDAPDEY